VCVCVDAVLHFTTIEQVHTLSSVERGLQAFDQLGKGNKQAPVICFGGFERARKVERKGRLKERRESKADVIGAGSFP
jgi:hypothetical protein